MSDETQALAPRCQGTDREKPCRLPVGHPGRCANSRAQALWEWREKAQALTTENTRLRAALEAIAAYDTDYTVGPAENVNRLQAIADAAISKAVSP